jgi:glutamate formiminotransferase
MSALIECIPNFSEGKDKNVLDAIAHAITKVKGTKLLHIDQGEAANRTVFTFVGDKQSVFDSAFEAIKVASEKIDMRKHKGTHPRIGAVDVCPFVPIKGIDFEELIVLHKDFAAKIWNELSIPVYLYEKSTNDKERKKLSYLRKGEYEGLQSKIESGTFEPDYGKAVFNPKSGILITGVRSFLLAYNINLKTKDVEIAKKIASLIRESSPTGLPFVKAIGWYIQDFDKVQVSTNISDFKTTSIFEVFEKVNEYAKLLGTEVTGSELIGLLPLEALAHKSMDIDQAIEYLGLSEIKYFDKNKRILENLL